MRPTYLRELSELALFGVPLLVGASIAAWEFTGIWGHMEEMLATALIAGGALGIVQGVLDRIRREDHFFLHRPRSAVKLHLARSLAGLTVAVVAWAAFAGLFEWFTRIREADFQSRPSIPGIVDWSRAWFHMSWGHALLLLAAMLLPWILMRLIVATRALRAAFMMLLVLPWLVLSWGVRQGALLETALPVFAFVLVCGATHTLRLAGDTP